MRGHPPFAVEMLGQRSDDALEVFDRALGTADRRTQRDRDERTRHARRQTTETVRRFVQLGRLVLEARLNGDPARADRAPDRPPPPEAVPSRKVGRANGWISVSAENAS